MSDLLPCAHCGGEAAIHSHCVPDPAPGNHNAIECCSCGVTTGKFEPLDKAKERWNRRAQGWREIDTAPRDGTWVLLTGGKVDIGWDGDSPPTSVSAQYAEDHWHFAWYDGGYYGIYKDPTHWMPIPPC